MKKRGESKKVGLAMLKMEGDENLGSGEKGRREEAWR